MLSKIDLKKIEKLLLSLPTTAIEMSVLTEEDDVLQSSNYEKAEDIIEILRDENEDFNFTLLNTYKNRIAVSVDDEDDYVFEFNAIEYSKPSDFGL